MSSQTLGDLSLEELFSPDRNLEQDIENVLLEKEGLTDIDPESRGPHIDARRLMFIENYTGVPFIQTGANNVTDPLYFASIQVNYAYRSLYNILAARILLETKASDLLYGQFTNAPWLSIHKYPGKAGLRRTTLARLETIFKTLPFEKRMAAWRSILRMVEFNIGLENIPQTDLEDLDASIRRSFGYREDIQSVYLSLNPQPDLLQQLSGYPPFFISDRLYKYLGIQMTNIQRGIMNYSLLSIFAMALLSFALYLRKLNRIFKSKELNLD